MNPSDFDTWLQRHRNVHSSVNAMFKERSQDAQDELHDAFRMVLKDIDFEDAEKATDHMIANPNSQPSRYNHWIGRVKEIAQEIASDRKEGDAKYLYTPKVDAKCHHCTDSGRVSVWKSSIPSAAHIQFYDTEHFFRVSDCRVGIACMCERGGHLLNDPSYGYLNRDIRFDPDVHEIYTFKESKARRARRKAGENPESSPEPIPGGVFNTDEVPF